MKRTHFATRLLAPAALVFALAACSGSTTADSPAPKSDERVPKAAGVQWTHLRELDELAEKAEPLADDPRRIKPMRELAPSLKEAALKVAMDAPPAGSKDAKQVATLQADLKALAESIVDPATAKAEDLANFGKAIHPIVEELMGAANMPHVHEHEENGEHDAGH